MPRSRRTSRNGQRSKPQAKIYGEQSEGNFNSEIDYQEDSDGWEVSLNLEVGGVGFGFSVSDEDVV